MTGTETLMFCVCRCSMNTEMYANVNGNHTFPNSSSSKHDHPEIY